MGNVTEREIQVATNIEIFFIAAVFLFIFWILYPQDRIMENAIKEDKNLDLTEIYLRNIVTKYPSSIDAHFALSEIYIKQGKIENARQALTPLNRFSDKKILAKRDLYMARIALMDIPEENSDEILTDVRKYYCSESFMQLEHKEKYLSEYINTLISNRLYKEAENASIEAMGKTNDFEYKKLCFSLYLKSLRAGGDVKKKIEELDKYATFFISDDELLNEILKMYLEAERPDKAAKFAKKALMTRKLL